MTIEQLCHEMGITGYQIVPTSTSKPGIITLDRKDSIQKINIQGLRLELRHVNTDTAYTPALGTDLVTMYTFVFVEED